jgi:aspartate carbamoyltransferase catalytic subunit
MRHIIGFDDISPEEWEDLYALTERIIERPGDYTGACAGRVMASLFYEPSTRTNFSFQAAMHRLGGGVMGFADPMVTSEAKGETMGDTIVMVSGYADTVVMRHPFAGAAKAASLYASCPIVNAGDGGHFHPTQTLTDLATIARLRDSPRGMSVGICGDLKYGRTVHSLITALARFPGVILHLISPRELAVPPYMRAFMQERGVKFFEITNLEAALGSLDVLYMTRIQRERFPSPAEYERLRGCYILTARKLVLAKKDLLILHPLPRVDDIHTAVDADPRAR